MSKTEIKSQNQSGGITAQNVNIQGDNSHASFGASRSPKQKKPLSKVLKIISAIVLFLAALVAILEYFKISPF